MNQLWVRISLTFVAIVIFLIIVPSVIYLTIQADEINLSYSDGIHSDQPPEGDRITILSRLIGYRESEIVFRLVRIFLSISFYYKFAGNFFILLQQFKSWIIQSAGNSKKVLSPLHPLFHIF